MQNLVGLKELRQNMSKYANKVSKGETFIVFKQAKPLFRICPLEKEEKWELVTDFTKIKKGGVDIDEVLSRL
jgi:antitoxin (DNA-binding transcriptional repressor) of toxin-antitoxin stability system